MNIPSMSQEMLRYFMQLNDAEQQSVLQMLKTFLSSRKDEIRPVSLDAYNKELEQADAEIEAGEYITHEEVMKRYFQK